MPLGKLKYQHQFREAINEIHKVLSEGEKTHKEDEWKSGRDPFVNIRYHQLHAERHLNAIPSVNYKTVEFLDAAIENTSHAATRLLMELQLFLEMRESMTSK